MQHFITCKNSLLTKTSRILKKVSFAILTFLYSFDVSAQCTPGSNTGANCVLWTTNVNIQGTSLNNSTGCSGPYTAYPASGNTTANLTTGNTYTVNVSSDGVYNTFCSIWLDVNNDGVFSCSHGDELVVKNLVIPEAPFGAPGAQTATANFLVPSLAFGGNTRLRVRIDHLQSTYGSGGVIDPCAPLIYGETEDYTVNIIPNGVPACAPALIVPNPTIEGPQNNFENVQLTGNWWNGNSMTTSDYSNMGSLFQPPTPYPAGSGVLGFFISQQYEEYVGTCLASPFLAGVTYSFQMSMASNDPNNPTAQPTWCPVDITLYGNTTCGNYPFTGQYNNSCGSCGCPSASNWPVLATTNYTPTNSWSTVTFTFTPTVDINAIVIGGPCTVPSCYPLVASGSNGFPYFFVDNIVINTSLTITQTGDFCSNNVVLTGSGVNTPGATYQWYLDGVPLTGETNNVLDVSSNGFGTGNYTLLAEFDCTCAQASYLVTSSPQPLTVSYPLNTYCQNSATETPTITGNNGGTFSATPAGLTIDPTTGEIDLTSPVNTYTVSYITPGVCGDTATFIVSITNGNSADFSYAGPYCQGGTNVSPTLSPGSIAGTFTSTPVGLVFVSGLTGEVDLSASASGTYTVTNTIPASGGCPATSSTATITITTGNSADFSFAGPYCPNGTDPTPTIDPGSSAGTFTSTPSGLFFLGVNGAVDLSASTPGTYTVTNTVPASGSCPAVSATSTITIDPVQNAGFTYPNNSYCQSTGNATPTISGTSGGTFSVTPLGLIVDPTTGAIDLSSPANSYTITYTTPGPCGNSSSQIVQITSSLFITVSSTEICEGQVATLNAVPSVPGGTFSWIPGGQSNGSIDVSPTQTTTYTVTYDLNGCIATGTGVVTVDHVDASITTPYSTISSGETIELHSGNANGYLWNSGQTTQTISVSPTENTTYCVVVTENGCMDSTCIKIEIGCESVVYAPNCITADGDQINDVFIVQTYCISEFHLFIVNRWGEIIFETWDMTDSWDGTYKEKPVPDGVYTYVIIAKGIDNKYYEIQGFVTVLR